MRTLIPAFVSRALLATALAGSALLAACGGGGTVPDPAGERRPLPAAFTEREAINYSPFRSSNRDTETITKAMITEDLRLIRQAGLGLIRLFDSSDMVAKQTLEVIRDEGIDLKVQLGMYPLRNQEAFNQAEIARGVALARDFRSIVVGVSVGNETMVSWSFNPISPTEMTRYLKQVRSQVTQPVTTDDNWAFYAAAPQELLDTIDYAAVHSYPLLDTIFQPGLWDWQQTAVPAEQRAAAMVAAAIASAKREIGAVRTYLDSVGRRNLPLVIGETGWKAAPSGGETMRAHPVNQQLYVQALREWQAEGRRTGTGPQAVFVFQAFDEPWKQGDDLWGFFNVNRQARCVVRAAFPSSQWAPGGCAPTDAVYYVPPATNPAVTATRYTVYAETVTAGEARHPDPLGWQAWENNSTAVLAVDQSVADAAEGSKVLTVTPRPLSWGWGAFAALPNRTEDLSAFQASGTLNFSIRTTYPGSLEVGFFTGRAADGSAYDVYIPLVPGQYGYQNDGQWHQVSIPLSAIIARGAMAFGMTDPSLSRLQMNQVANSFVIGDRYAVTGKSQNAGHVNPIQLDGIFWAR